MRNMPVSEQDKNSKAKDAAPEQIKSRRRKRSKVSAREAMHAKRAKAPEINPAPPGPAGGQYTPLSESDLQQIYQCALNILANIGLGEAPPKLVQQAVECGAVVNEKGR